MLRFSVDQFADAFRVWDSLMQQPVMTVLAAYPAAKNRCFDYCEQLNNHFGGTPEPPETEPIYAGVS